MPGHVDVLDATSVQGWARHAVHADYAMLVHLLADGRVVASTLADLPRGDGLPGFMLTRPASAATGRLAVMLGETGEMLALPPSAPAAPARLSVEDLLALAPVGRWRDGSCVRDAEAWGMRLETIVELLCQDFMAGAMTGELLRAAWARARRAGPDAVRRMLIGTPAYRMRLVYADRAPGGIFARALVRESAARDVPTLRLGAASAREVSAAELLALEGRDFITACYRRLLLKEPDPEGMAHYEARLRRGDTKLDIIRFIGDELESIRAGIVLVDLPEDE